MNLMIIVRISCILIGSFLLSSCIGGKKVVVNEKLSTNKFIGDKIVMSENRIVTVPKKYLDPFKKCFNSSSFITKPTSNQPYYISSYYYFNDKIHSCVLMQAYRGDERAIDFLADYIKVIGPTNFDINFRYFRGKKLMLALIDVCYTMDCEPNKNGISIANNAFVALHQSIRTVNGMKTAKWFRSIRIKDPIDSNVCYEGYEVIQKLDKLKQAIAKNQVVLKDYGEE